MKIGIITSPLALNYGGILQNYALQQTLLRLGHEVYTINRNNIPLIYCTGISKRFQFYIKHLIKKLIGRPTQPLYYEFRRIGKHCRRFVRENIITTEMYKNQKELYSIVKAYNFDCFVVGSDQVWRPCYSENIYNAFLDFCQNRIDVKRIAYAASYGVRDWEFDNEETKECSRLLKLFDAVSVREDSGVELSEEYFDVNTIQVLDPTFLLEKADYVKLVEQNNEQISEGTLFCYILDNNELIENAIHYIEGKTALKPFQVKPPQSDIMSKGWKNVKDYVIPSPTKWLRAFMDAEMVFTDSFHGCVFSIIFNKPFWVIGNKERGNARFDSLLKLFNIENRRIMLDEINNINLSVGIDWEKVNSTKKEWIKKSINFLNSNL